MSEENGALLESGSGPYYRRLASHLMKEISTGR
jgi:hypothetical protein